MKDCLIDALLDTVKISPYLILTFIILEFIEHKLDKKNEKILTKNKKYGPIIGGIVGAIPQCGFSAMASNLFSNRVITIGTLIAIYLSTSDEMLPIMISEKTSIKIILPIIITKMIIGILAGLLIDIILKQKNKKMTISEMCDEEHCHCEEDGILLSSLKHTIKILLFILIANVLINTAIFYIGEESLSNLLQNQNILKYYISSLIGLIPNCASSVIITKLYLSNIISIGTLLSGLLTGSGIGLLLLFKQNKNIKENLFILTVIYIIGVTVGILVDIII